MAPARAQETAAPSPEIERLKAQLAAQQEQIDQLRRTLDEQKKVLDQATQPKPPSLGQVASTTAMVPAGDVAPVLHPALAAAAAIPQGTVAPESPLQLKIGSATFTPLGFMDMTAVYRSVDGGSGIGTSFGSIPYSNASTGLGQLGEMRFSAQNSRIGARIDATVHDTHVMGYWESDFLGNQSTNASVSSNSITFRMRLYFVDLRTGKWEVLGGQSWSMMTPGRKGISPLPSDIFYSQNMDTNYQVGLSWTRAPQFRFVYHASDVVSLGFALEQAEQYGGGSSGGGSIVLPSNLSTAYTNNQIDMGAASFTPPNLHPDIQAKLAFDPVVDDNLLHFEVGGVFSSFKTYNPLTSQGFTKHGGGVEANANLEITKGFHLIFNTFLSDGEGRYLFGQAPDLTILPTGAPSPLHASSILPGFEYTTGNSTIFAYYGEDFIGTETSLDPSNKNAFIGYGYPKSANSQNRHIKEGTIGLNQTFWKNPNYGALSAIFQYSYLSRDPWWFVSGVPASAHANMVWVDLRYSLPGQAPKY
jgi:hypothetical protein